MGEADNILQKLSDKDYYTSKSNTSFLYPSASFIVFSGSSLKDTPYQSSHLNRDALSLILLFTVWNVLFVRELTRKQPANSPIIVTAITLGFCKSQLAWHVPFTTRLVMTIMTALLGRTAEESSRQLVWAAIGGAGREFELRGAYVSMADIKEVSDFVLSDDGAAAQADMGAS